MDLEWLNFICTITNSVTANVGVNVTELDMINQETLNWTVSLQHRYIVTKLTTSHLTVRRQCIALLSFHHMKKAAELSFKCFPQDQETWLQYPFMFLCVQDSLVQFGAVPDHVPFAKHWRVGEPVSKYPSIHEYTMEWEKVVPSTREIRPWVGVAGLLHCTAARQGRKKRRWRSEV